MIARSRIVEFLSRGAVLAFSGGFLAWYLWAKLSSLPGGVWSN